MLSASALATMLLPVKFATPADAKTPGSTYCYHGICHRVKTIEETAALVGVEESIVASHYDDCSRDRYNPCGLTSSGERFHPDRPDNTASPIYPDGTMLLVWSPETERALVVRVNNAGPYWGDRKLDLSRAAAEKLGFEGKGVAGVSIRVIKAPEPEEAVYVENRNYRPVPGDIGVYASLQQAQFGMAVALALQASAASPLAPVTTANAFAMPGVERAELVAEAPQALGRGRLQLAALGSPSTLASLTSGGHGLEGSLLKSLKLSHATTQSRGELAALSPGRGSNQSVWGEDLPDAAPANDAVVADAGKTVASDDDTEAADTAAADAERRRETQRSARREKQQEIAERPSRKAHARAERRERTTRVGRADRRQAAYAAQGYERRPPRPERTAEQIMSLGIRAQSSSTM